MSINLLVQTILNVPGPDHGSKIRGELQDYMAHQVTRYLGPPPIDPFELMDWEARYDLLRDFCIKSMGMAE